jgi:hypothetical protein
MPRPGHTDGSLVIFDKSTGDLFTGDSFGSNSPTIPDALWLQFTPTPLDAYLATVKTTRSNFRGQVKYLMTGHNDRPLVGEKYLDNLQAALQSLMDQGDKVLVPSYRPTGALQVTIGDRMHDPDWVAINVNKAHYLPEPVDKIAGLTRISVEDATLTPRFTPGVKAYTAKLAQSPSNTKIVVEPTSTRSSRLAIDGKTATAGQAHSIALPSNSTPIHIEIVSPDGTQHAEYLVTVVKP